MKFKDVLCVIQLHDWPKWGRIEKRKVLEGTILEDAAEVQRRTCDNCHATNFRKVANV